MEVCCLGGSHPSTARSLSWQKLKFPGAMYSLQDDLPSDTQRVSALLGWMHRKLLWDTQETAETTFDPAP